MPRFSSENYTQLVEELKGFFERQGSSPTSAAVAVRDLFRAYAARSPGHYYAQNWLDLADAVDAELEKLAVL